MKDRAPRGLAGGTGACSRSSTGGSDDERREPSWGVVCGGREGPESPTIRRNQILGELVTQSMATAHIEIPLSNWHEPALVDIDDFDVVSGYTWRQRKKPADWVRYAHATKRKKLVVMHTLLTGWSLVDHINRNGLDNRRSNLRPATTAENARNSKLYENNTSGYRGVSWHKRDRCWRTQIKVSGKLLELGRFQSPEEAARAYDEASLRYHGEFGRRNFT